MIIFMLHFLVMLTTLKAINLEIDRTGYVNGWDERMDWTAENNRMVTGLYSVHDSHKDDRKWKFYHGSAEGITTSGCQWSDTLNSYDKKFTFECKPDHAITGFLSWHNNHNEDRRWTIRCCRVHGASLLVKDWGGYRNNWEENLDYECNSDEVVTGLYSYHSNSYEDRRWKIRCAQFGVQPDHHIESKLSGYWFFLPYYFLKCFTIYLFSKLTPRIYQ